jgi:hypothetical protein
MANNHFSLVRTNGHLLIIWFAILVPPFLSHLSDPYSTAILYVAPFCSNPGAWRKDSLRAVSVGDYIISTDGMQISKPRLVGSGALEGLRAQL